MPELTVTHYGLLAGALIIGVLIGWFFRGDRSAKEKMAINAGWQDQVESQQAEHNRLAEQNTSLMDQISQYQASHKDSANRARELSDSLKEAFTARDELQRKFKDLRGALEVAIAQRDKLKSELDTHNARSSASTAQLKDKDDKIFKLSRELTSWQNRVPPLVEKYQARDKQVAELEALLQEANAALESYERQESSEHTRIEPVDQDALPDGLDASNEQYPPTAINDVSELQDQVRHANSAAGSNGLEDTGFQRSNHFLHEDVASADNLQAIKGVGPAIERTLNTLGIYRYLQIAEMSEYDIDRVARELKGFRSRIYREDWIGQARNLQYQKTNNSS